MNVSIRKSLYRMVVLVYFGSGGLGGMPAAAMFMCFLE